MKKLFLVVRLETVTGSRAYKKGATLCHNVTINFRVSGVL
jgi:hypothetical protein